MARNIITATSGGVLPNDGTQSDSFITAVMLTFLPAPTYWKPRALICLLVLALMTTEWRSMSCIHVEARESHTHTYEWQASRTHARMVHEGGRCNPAYMSQGV